MNCHQELLNRIKHINFVCQKLCKITLGRYLKVSGNIGVFSQSVEEYKIFTKVRDEITEPSTNPNQKYYHLYNPIIIPAEIDIPETTYTHIYIRKLDSTPYGRYLGDVDFVLDSGEYIELKNKVLSGTVKGAEIYDRPGWDTIQLTTPNFDCVAYVSTKEFAEKVRVKF